MTSQRLIALVRANDALVGKDIDIQDQEIYVAASLAQEELLRDYQLLEKQILFTLVPSIEVYTWEEENFSWLKGMNYVRDPMLYDDPKLGVIREVDQRWVEKDKQRVAAGGPKPLPPKYFYILRDDPLSFGIYYKPDAPYLVRATFGLGHAEYGDISETVNPRIPDRYTALFLFATLEKIFQLRGPKYANEATYFAKLAQIEGEKVRAFQISRDAHFMKLNRITWR